MRKREYVLNHHNLNASTVCPRKIYSVFKLRYFFFQDAVLPEYFLLTIKLKLLSIWTGSDAVVLTCEIACLHKTCLFPSPTFSI